MNFLNRYRIGFFATRVCGHPLCNAESPNPHLTLRFWRVPAGWQTQEHAIR